MPQIMRSHHDDNRILEANQVTKRYKAHEVLCGVSFTVEQGEFVGVIGPNGSGKSTLLHALSGIDALDEGTILLEGKSIAAYSRKAIARKLSILQQEALPNVGFTVREIVEMGRYPFQNWLGEEPESEAGQLIVDGLMESLSLSALGERQCSQLSGGERQRVALAKALAQQPDVLLLDEPTTYMDIGSQIHMMDYVRGWQRQKQRTVIAVLHDLNLAALYCDRLLLLHEGKVVAIGTPADILQAPLIAQVYGTTPLILTHPASAVPQVLLQSNV